MTRKDFELIANAMREAYHETQFSDGTAVAIIRLSKALASTNPRFDETRFMKACGLSIK